MKLEQLDNGNLLFNGVEYAPVEKRPRELPAVPIDTDQLPVRVTLRCGKHYTATQSKSSKYVLCAEKDRTGHWITVALDGFFLECKKPGDYDIIHVGKWLTADEQEAMRNE